jgi:purine-binding chemotaxis protein CheW
MERLHLLARIAGQRVAFDATAIESVVELEALASVPRAPAHVAGLAALRSRVLTVIDSHAALGIGAIARGPLMPAIIASVDGHLYGLLVDSIDDVAALAAPAAPIRGRIAAGWSHAAPLGVEHDGALLLLLDPAALVAGPAVRAA